MKRARGRSTVQEEEKHPPVDSAGTLVRLDVDVVMVDFQFGDLHLKEVGLQLDRPAHGAKVWPRRRLEHIFWHRGGWGVCGRQAGGQHERGSPDRHNLTLKRRGTRQSC